MFNRQSKSIKEVLPKSESIDLIGVDVGGKTITNIEVNGQIRVIDTEEVTPEMVERWKENFQESGLRFHEGQLLTEHDSQELYEKLEEVDA